MRRLLIVSVLLLALIGVSIWLVVPMFVFPSEGSLDECRRCEELLAYAPARSNVVVVVPRGGTSLFEFLRRIVPGRDLQRVLPAPGLLAIGLGEAPVVGWQDSNGRYGAAAAPSGGRGLLLRLATLRNGGSPLAWADGGVLLVGDAGARPRDRSLEGFARVRSRRGHFFMTHAVPRGQSIAHLGPETLDVTTYPDSATVAPPRHASHPSAAVLSLVVPDVSAALDPIEKILPLEVAEWRGRRGRIIIYGVDASGLLPSIQGLLIVEGRYDPRDALERTVPRVEGATQDTKRDVEGVEVFRRETLGVVVEAASRDDELLVSFDGTSISRWLGSEPRVDEAASIWSFSCDPAALSTAVHELMESPGRHLLRGSARRTLKRLGDLVGAFRNATNAHSQLEEGPDGPEIRTRVEW